MPSFALTPEKIEQTRQTFIDERVSVWFLEPPIFEPRATLYFRILDELTREIALQAGASADLDLDSLKKKYQDAENLFSWLQSFATAATGQHADSEGWWDLWRHIQVEPRDAGETVFPLATTDLEQLSEMTAVYLAQPARSRLLDRTLIDMMVAFEVFHLANALYWQSDVRGLTTHALDRTPPRTFLGSLAWFVALIVLASIALILFTLASKVSAGAGEAADLALIVGSVIAGAVIILIDRWVAARRKARERLRCMRLCDEMFAAYTLLASGEIAASEVAKVVLAVAKYGAVWPTALLKLLSDTVERNTEL